MNRQFNRTGFAGLAILTAIAVQTPALSAEGTSAFDASKQKCDVTLSVDDLGNIHPPKAKRRFKIALVLQCAPRAGQFHAAVLTVCRA